VYRNKKAFTITEILFVIMLLGLLASIVVPQFGEATNDARLSNLRKNLQRVRCQLELYRLNHDGTYPTDIAAQLTEKTDEDGTVDASGMYGPYLLHFPANPFIDDSDRAVATDGGDGDGWNYTAQTGEFLANSTGHAGL